MTYQMCWAQLVGNEDWIRRGNLIFSLEGGGEIEAGYCFATEAEYQLHAERAVFNRVDIQTAYDPMADASKLNGEFFYPSMVHALGSLFQQQAERQREAREATRRHIMMMPADYNLKVMDQRRIIRGGM